MGDTLRFASGNLQRTGPGHTPADMLDDVDWMIREWRPDAIGLQEAREVVPALRVYLETVGYALALPWSPGPKDTGSRANNPIVYNADTLELTGCDVVPVHPGKAGEFPERNVTWARWLWAGGDGSTVYLNNTQANSHIELGGGPRQLPRVELSTAHFATMATMMRGDASGQALSFGLGDLNVDHDADKRVGFSGFPAATFGAAGFVDVYDELSVPKDWDTLGWRKIDDIWRFTGDTRGSFVPGSLVKHDGKADHHHICVDVKVRPKAQTPAEQLARILEVNQVAGSYSDRLHLAESLLRAGVKLS